MTSSADTEPKTASILPTGATGSTPIGAGVADVSQEDKPRVSIVSSFLAITPTVFASVARFADPLNRLLLLRSTLLMDTLWETMSSRKLSTLTVSPVSQHSIASALNTDIYAKTNKESRAAS